MNFFENNLLTRVQNSCFEIIHLIFFSKIPAAKYLFLVDRLLIDNIKNKKILPYCYKLKMKLSHMGNISKSCMRFNPWYIYIKTIRYLCPLSYFIIAKKFYSSFHLKLDLTILGNVCFFMYSECAYFKVKENKLRIGLCLYFLII